jgi:hypothetical protein
VRLRHIPSVQQFSAARRGPFDNGSALSARQLAPNKLQRANIDHGAILGEEGVKVGRWMIVGIHHYLYTVDDCYRWHLIPPL